MVHKNGKTIVGLKKSPFFIAKADNKTAFMKCLSSLLFKEKYIIYNVLFAHDEFHWIDIYHYNKFTYGNLKCTVSNSVLEIDVHKA